MVCDECAEREAVHIREFDEYPKDARRRKVRHYVKVGLCEYCYQRRLNLMLREAVDGPSKVG